MVLLSGAVSLLCAIRCMAHASSQFVLHLRTLNPHVADAGPDKAARAAIMPRAAAPTVCRRLGDRLGAATGVSAFAYQGARVEVVDLDVSQRSLLLVSSTMILARSSCFSWVSHRP